MGVNVGESVGVRLAAAVAVATAGGAAQAASSKGNDHDLCRPQHNSRLANMTESGYAGIVIEPNRNAVRPSGQLQAVVDG